MPLVIAVAIRWLIMSLAQGLLFGVGVSLLEPLIEKAKVALKESFGLSDDDAITYIANFILDVILYAGITAATLKTKLPVKIADKLGYTSKGFVKRPLSAKAKAALPDTAVVAAQVSGKKITNAADLIEIAEKVRPAASKLALGGWATALSVLGLGNLMYMNMLNTLDFGAWNNSAYQEFFQKILFFLPVDPKSNLPNSKVLSQETWQKVYAGLTTLGAQEIIDPETGVRQPFTREAAIKAVDFIAATILADGGQADTRKVMGTLAAYIIKGVATPGAGGTSLSGGTLGGGIGVGSAKTAPVQIQIYTGVISQGTLGLPNEFVARQDDMIDSLAELSAATRNNLVGFVASMPSKFFYEVAIQPTVKTRSGTAIKGDAVKVLTGYTTKGVPRYKTVYHKFAVLKLSVNDENGRVVKLATITLGPVNAVDFQPTQADVASLMSSIKADTFTSNIKDIKSIVSPTGISVLGTVPPNPNPPTGTLASATLGVPNSNPAGGARFIASNVTFAIPAGGSIFVQNNPRGVTPLVYARSGNVVRMLNLESLVPLYDKGGYSAFKADDGSEKQVTNIGQVWDAGIARFEAKTGLKFYDLPQQNPADLEAAFNRGTNSTLPDQMTPFSGTNALNDFVAFVQNLKPGGDIDITKPANAPVGDAQSAVSLKQLYAAYGKVLPDLSIRGIIYENSGFGGRSTYTGTEEQNNRLVAFLKENPNILAGG